MKRASLPLLGLALVLASCGGGDSETPDEPPEELLRTAFANPASSGEAVADVDLLLEGPTLLSGPLIADVAGPFEVDPAGGLPAFDLEVDAELAGYGVDAELISTGEDAFVVFFGENYQVGPDRIAAAEARLAAGGGAGGLGLDPASWFESPSYAGGEEVEGTETERIEGALDSAAMAEDLSAATTALGAPALLSALVQGAGPGEAEAWVAYDDSTVRRTRVAFPFEIPPAQQEAAFGVTGGTAELGFEISDVGADVEIAPPPGGGFQPVEDLLARLRDLASLGGL